MSLPVETNKSKYSLVVMTNKLKQIKENLRMTRFSLKLIQDLVLQKTTMMMTLMLIVIFTKVKCKLRI